MKRFILHFFLALGLWQSPLGAQTANDPNEGSRLNWDSTNSVFRFSWWGRAGRTYFIQQSDNLLNAWIYLPVIEPGGDAVKEWGFTSNGDKCFLRLQCSDIPTDDPWAADFDGDGVGNYDELLQGTDPFKNLDTDNDGLPDDWEIRHFGNLNQSGTDDADGDGLSNSAEWSAGTDASSISSGGSGIPDGWLTAHGFDPNSNPGDEDTDGDGFTNYQEYLAGTDPRNTDSDGDGIPDGYDPHPKVAEPSTPYSVTVVAPDVERFNNGEIQWNEVDFTKVELRWETEGANTTSFLIEKRTSTGEFEELARVGTSEHKQEDTGLLANQHYYYRISAINETAEGKATSTAYSVTYDVPFLKGLSVRRASLSRWKDGFYEFANPSTPPKVYLVKADTSNVAGSDSGSGDGWSWSKNWSGQYSFTQTIVPAQHSRSYAGIYSYSDHDGGSDFSGTWSSSSSISSSYNWFDQGRGKQNLTSTNQRNTQSDYSSSWSDSEGTSGSSGRGMTGSYLLQETYQPNTGNPVWLGNDFDLSIGRIAYSGSSSYTDYSSSSSGSTNTLASSAPDSGGNWSGSSTYSWNYDNDSGSNTSSLSSPAWSGGWYPHVWWWGGSLTEETPTTRMYSWQYSHGSIFESSQSTETLSQEYATSAFMTDVIADLPDWPQQWEDNWWGWGWYNGWGWWGWYGYPWYGWWTASRDLNTTEDWFGVSRMQYRFTASPTIPFTFEWVEIFVPEDDPATQENESESPKVVASHSWEAPVGGGESPIFEIDPSQREDGDGNYYITRPTRLYAWSDSGAWLDENEKKQRGITLTASLQRPPGAEENSPERKVLGNVSFWCNVSAVPHSTHKFTWEGNAATLVLNGVYTNGQWGTREIHSGDSVTYEEIMSSSMSFNLTVDPKLMTTPFVEIKVTSKDAHGNSLGEDTIKAHFMPEMMVDANRDGKMSWVEGTDTDPEGLTEAIHGADQYEAWTPYTFWLNDDNDSDNEDHPGSSQKDCSDNAIQSVRDLEDFTRLWISFRGMTDLVKSSGVSVRLEWLPESGTEWSAADGEPAIKIQKAVETDGGTAYLTDETTGSLQWGGGGLGGGGSGCLGEVRKGAPLELPASTFNGAFGALDEQSPSLFALFEGSGEGKGRLRLTVRKNGVVLAQAGEIRLHIKNVKQIYQRVKAWPEGIRAPQEQVSESGVFTGPVSVRADENGPLFLADPNEQKKAVIFVHGWSMNYPNSVNFSETMFKRLWHQGFTGRFCMFRWDPIVVNTVGDIEVSNGEYNRSEHRAWVYGKALKMFAEQLKNQGLAVTLIGHSMGNIVCGSALREGLTVDNYLLMEAAVPAGCFDESGAINSYKDFLDQEAIEPTPDFYQDPSGQMTKGYRGFLKGIGDNAARVVNFHNYLDFALATGKKYGFDANWEKNQIDYKPDGNGATIWRYFYIQTIAGEDNRARLRVNSFNGRNVTHPWERMAFVARPRSKAVGAVAGTSDNPLPHGAIKENVNLQKGYSFDDRESDHSGQFNRNIQELDELYHLIEEIIVPPDAL